MGLPRLGSPRRVACGGPAFHCSVLMGLLLGGRSSTLAPRVRFLFLPPF